MKIKISILVGLCLGAFFLRSTTSAASLEGAWGGGLFADLNIPVLGLRNWYSYGPKFGVVFHRMSGPKRGVEFEYHHARFTDGSIQDRMFTWGVDGRQYRSPSAKADMAFNSAALNFVFYFPQNGREVSGEGGAPYLVFGAGFYDYAHEVSGLVYPGQNVEPLDMSLTLRPVEDTRTAVSINAGGGFQVFMSRKASLDFRLRYHFIFGELRAFRDWGLKTTFPFSILDIGVGLKFYV